MPDFKAQPLVDPLPTGLSLQGKTVVVTGSTAGLGLETSRQALILRASTVVLACRNVSKGEAVKKQLLEDSIVKKHNPTPTVLVIKVDMGDNQSILSFASLLKSSVSAVDVLILNAGLGFLENFETSASGHETTYQINYISNVLLLCALLPYLEESAAKRGYPVRVTWVGSRGMYETSLTNKQISENETVSQYFDDKRNYSYTKQYADTKLLCAMFLYELAGRVDKEKVIINQMCPGMIMTDMSDNLPWLLKYVAKILKAARARSVEEGGWMVLHAAVVEGLDSHCRFIEDKTIVKPMPFILSDIGKALQSKLWKDTITEMRDLTEVPSSFRSTP